MAKYEIREDGGAREIIDAESMDAAMVQARDWAASGSYDSRVMVTVWCAALGADGDYTGEQERDEVEAGPEPEVPECADGNEHEWEAPYEVVGGVKENPGVWSRGGTTMTFHTVCLHCGTHRHETTYGSQRNPGQADQTRYADADEASLAWVASERGA